MQALLIGRLKEIWILNYDMYKTWVLLFVCVSRWFMPAICLDDLSDCEATPLEKCNLEINIELIPGNETHLLDICGIIQKYRLCILRNKFETKDLCGWPLVLHKAEPLMNELCFGNTPLRQNYLEVSTCFKTALSTHERECRILTDNRYSEFIRNFPNSELDISERCLKSTVMGKCYRRFILRECGKTAEYVYSKILERTFFYYLMCVSPEQHQSHLDSDSDYIDNLEHYEFYAHLNRLKTQKITQMNIDHLEL